MSKESLVTAHNQILHQARKSGRHTLFFAYELGALYSVCYARAKDIKPKEWFQTTLHVSYSNATRYMNVAALISTIPRLITCEITFTQMAAHAKNIEAFLKWEVPQETYLAFCKPIMIQIGGKAAEKFPRC